MIFGLVDQIFMPIYYVDMLSVFHLNISICSVQLQFLFFNPILLHRLFYKHKSSFFPQLFPYLFLNDTALYSGLKLPHNYFSNNMDFNSAVLIFNFLLSDILKVFSIT